MGVGRFAGSGRVPARSTSSGLSRTGSDCSGVVTDLGPGAGTDSDLAVGQRVWGIAHGSLGTAVASPDATLVAMPPSGDVMDFSALPTAFAAAQQALRSVAGVRPGDTVLVHAAAGAVGLGTLQARFSAVEIFPSATRGGCV